jgi:cell division protein FtsZ
LLEGTSVNGARGVIINVTGGPDLSLVEVSEASSIVQEAADEDANIIFGAVVDPSLKGKVKITVIATGFGEPARTSPSAVQTPVDMTHYADHARVRVDAASTPAAPAPSRLSFARRALLDLPAIAAAPAAGGGGSMSAQGPVALADPGVASDADTVAAPESEELATDLDFDLSATFDVPAFLRRQEG